ncbi:MAG: transketolase [Elusimicrobia bacterium]|nr:transketolase [Elusimicrobiota bacterium]
MRNAFAAEVTRLAAELPQLVLLSGDIGNRLFDEYKARFGPRFLNCGVAEADMIGVAAGMAMCGLRPVVYTIASFLATRAFEQIRVDLCYHRLPVVLVGVGGGFAYASLGATHHSTEEVGCLRLLPNMTVVCPGDPTEVRLALAAALRREDPVYIRIGKKGEPSVHAGEPAFSIGKGIVVREGAQVCLVSTGAMLPAAVAAAEALSLRGVSAQVVSMHTVKPLDHGLLAGVFSRCRVVATVEEHSLLGGLGAAVAEWLADRSLDVGGTAEPGARLVRFGAADEFFNVAGSQEDARAHFGLTPRHIAERVLKAMGSLRNK